MTTSPPRRRAVALAAAMMTLTVTAVACGRSPGASPSPAVTAPAPGSATGSPASRPRPEPTVSPTTSRPATPSTSPSAAARGCAQRVSDLSLRQQVGELLMVGVTSTGLTAGQRSALADSRAGSVVLLGNSRRGVRETAGVVRTVRAAADPPARIATLVAADQEGGLVQRLSGTGFRTIPPAQRQAGLSDAALAAQAALWGRELDQAGVDVDLAPVADVVPTSLANVNAPIGRLRRGYGPSPATVAAKVTAFTRGMHRAGRGTAVKHFPGLGRVRGNTDVTSNVVDSVTTRHDADLAGFAAAVAARTELVMVSSAIYSKIDADRRAAFSPVVIEGMLRHDLGFTGVVVSDDLSAAAMRDLSPGTRAVRFVSAGGDLAIVGNSVEAEPMARALVARATSDEKFAARVTESATRVVELKSTLGLAQCH